MQFRHRRNIPTWIQCGLDIRLFVNSWVDLNPAPTIELKVYCVLVQVLLILGMPIKLRITDLYPMMYSEVSGFRNRLKFQIPCTLRFNTFILLLNPSVGPFVSPYLKAFRFFR